jgi:hypothetical protein
VIGNGDNLYRSINNSTNTIKIYNVATAPAITIADPASYTVTSKVGIGTETPAYKLDVAGDLNADHIYIGGIEISTSSVTDTAKVAKAGDIMSGPLQTTTATLTGNAFSVGGSTLIVKTGSVGIGGTPDKQFQVTSLTAGEIIRIKDSNNKLFGFGTEDAGATFGARMYFDGTAFFGIESNAGVKIGAGYQAGNGIENGLIVQSSVGVGVALPTRALQVYGAGGGNVAQIGGPNAGLLFQEAAGTMSLIPQNGAGDNTIGHFRINPFSVSKGITLAASGAVNVGPLTTVNTADFSVGVTTFSVNKGEVGVGIAPVAGTRLSLRSEAENYALKFFNSASILLGGVYNQEAAGARLFLADNGGNTKISLDARAGQPSYINSGDDFGINTASPQGTLEIKSNEIPAGSVLFVSSQNATRMFSVFGNGRVAVGNITPAYNLDVSGNVRASGGFYGPGGYDTDSTDSRFYLQTRDADNATASAVEFRNDPALTTPGGKLFRIMNSTSEKLTVMYDGSVGIGTATPVATLHIKSDAAADYSLKISSANGTSVFGIHQNGHFSMYGSLAAVGTCANGAIESGSRDSAGSVNFTGANSTCQIVFGTPYDATPHCVLSGSSAGSAEGVHISTISTAGFTFLPGTGSWDNNDRVSYICLGAH